jgi:hypothetical protein
MNSALLNEPFNTFNLERLNIRADYDFVAHQITHLFQLIKPARRLAEEWKGPFLLPPCWKNEWERAGLTSRRRSTRATAAGDANITIQTFQSKGLRNPQR